MAKQLSTKVEHCPECGILKSKTKPCKHCGYDPTGSARSVPAQETVTKINLKLAGYDMTKYNCVVINGVEYHR